MKDLLPKPKKDDGDDSEDKESDRDFDENDPEQNDPNGDHSRKPRGMKELPKGIDKYRSIPFKIDVRVRLMVTDKLGPERPGRLGGDLDESVGDHRIGGEIEFRY